MPYIASHGCKYQSYERKWDWLCGILIWYNPITFYTKIYVDIMRNTKTSYFSNVCPRQYFKLLVKRTTKLDSVRKV